MDKIMKKILFATTALGLLASGAANASGPAVTVGGYADFQVGSGDQEGLYKHQTSAGAVASAAGADSSIYARDLHTRTDTNVHFKVDGKADNGLGYGAYIELNADTSANESSTSGQPAKRTYVYVESGFGRVETGATGDAGDALKVGAETFARATGGIAGDFSKYVDLAAGTIAGGSKYLITPGLPTATGLPGEENRGYAGGTLNNDTHSERANANKISYYTPRIQGLQAGVSYTPDQGEHGNASGFVSSNAGGTKFLDVWNAGINYQGQYDALTVAAAATGEWGSAKDTGATISTLDDLEAYSLGLNVSYAGFTVGGSWADAPEIGLTKTFGSSMHYWTLGGAYEFGPFAASVTYFDSTVEHGTSATAPDAEFQNISIGADYKLAPGLMPYVEVSFFETDNGVADNASTVDNNGTVFIVGTQLTF